MSKLTLEEYQKKPRGTAGNYIMGHSVVYPTLGLAEETGEVVYKIKKVLRDKGGVFSQSDLDGIELELGDVLSYVAAIAHILGLSLEDIAVKNLEKLQSRKALGVLTGSGDNR